MTKINVAYLPDRRENFFELIVNSFYNFML